MPFKRSFRVHWVDTDVAGVMHFTNYMRYFEACEEEFYRSISLPFNEITAKYGIYFPRVEAYCSYKTPIPLQRCFLRYDAGKRSG